MEPLSPRKARRSPPVPSFRAFPPSSDFLSPPPPFPRDSSLSRHSSPRRGSGGRQVFPIVHAKWSSSPAFQDLARFRRPLPPQSVLTDISVFFPPVTAVFCVLDRKRGGGTFPPRSRGGKASYSR